MATRYAGQRPWRAQSQAASRPSQSWLDAGLRLLINGATPDIDLVSRKTVSRTGARVIVAGADGLAFDADGSSRALSIPLNLSNTSAVTVVALLDVKSRPGSYNVFFEFTTDGNVDVGGFAAYNNVGLSRFDVGTKSDSGLDAISYSLPSIGRQVLAVVFDHTQTSGSQIQLWIDGVLQTSTGTQSASGSAGVFANSTLYIGARTASSLWADNEYFGLALFDRALSPSQHVELGRDYWQLFAPQSSRAPVAAGGAPDFPFTGSGGIAFAGAATAAYTAGYAATGSGGLSFNGNATTSHTGDYAVTATGGLTFAGSATCTFDTGYDITGSGGVQFGGAATVSSTADYAATGAGGLQFGGAATASSTAEYTATGAGGLAFGGAADAQLETGFSATGSGGINFGGAATVVGTADYLATGAGGLNLGGTAAVEFFSSAAPAQPASGGGGRQAAERRIRAMRQRAEAESSEQLIQAIIAMVVSGALDEMSIE